MALSVAKLIELIDGKEVFQDAGDEISTAIKNVMERSNSHN